MHRGDIDHPAVAALGHARQRMLHGVEGSAEVDGDDVVPFLRRLFGQRRGVLDAGAVHQDVDVAPGLHGFEHVGDLVGLAQVGIEVPRLAAGVGDAGQRRIDLLGRAQAVDGHAGAGVGQCLRDGQADAGGTAGHQCGAALQEAVHGGTPMLWGMVET